MVAVKRFTCGDLMPGCPRVVTGASDQSILDQFLEHGATDHGLTTNPPLSLLELVMAHTHPFCPDRSRGHLRLVDLRRGGQGTRGRRQPNAESRRGLPGNRESTRDRRTGRRME